MSKDEILSHRKNKFLSIGRNQGFSSQLEVNKDLSMKATFLENLYTNFNKNSKIYLSIFGILIFILFSIFIL